MNLATIRVLRTPASERFLVLNEGQDIAALDLHFLTDGRVAGTLSIFENTGIQEAEIESILKYLDHALLPDVSVEDGNLVFTVLIGKVIGNFLNGTTDLEP